MNQPIGFAVGDWKPPALPPRTPLVGRYCCVEPLDPERHAVSLHEANCLDAQGTIWTYLSYGPFASLEDYLDWMNATCCGSDPLFFAVVDNTTGKAGGVASYLRIDPENGSIEVGHINYSPRLQRTCSRAMRAATVRSSGSGARTRPGGARCSSSTASTETSCSIARRDFGKCSRWCGAG